MAERRTVVVLLTDGLPNDVPPADDGRVETTILRAAEQVKARGASLYTIGLGTALDVDADLLRAMASSPGQYLEAPDASDLGRLYAGIAREIRCPGGGQWPGGGR